MGVDRQNWIITQPLSKVLGPIAKMIATSPIVSYYREKRDAKEKIGTEPNNGPSSESFGNRDENPIQNAARWQDSRASTES
jgi:hypothetical protein